MKRVLVFIVVMAFLSACKKDAKTTATTQEENKEMAYQAFGAEISSEKALTVSDVSRKYANLKDGDTVTVKFKGEINEVCQKKGCWMTIDLDKEQTVMVRFKDYGFFVPMNAGAHETIVEGKAFVRETSVEELQHYAKDAGKSEEEIAAITTPKRELAFEASGVLIKK
ncbi:MAG: DUF4920 domain-containing protein [Bacteroidota bacterium]